MRYPPPPMAHRPYPLVNDGEYDDGYRGRTRGRSRSGERRAASAFHSKHVPKEADLEAQATTSSEAEKTTAMLRNIPNRYTQSILLAEIDDEGFSGQYDFFYLPMDVQNRSNVGYAFINFIHSSDMKRFCEHFAQRRFAQHASAQRLAKVSPAHINGLKDNVQHLTKKAVTTFKDPEWQPIILRNGERIRFSQALAELESGKL